MIHTTYETYRLDDFLLLASSGAHSSHKPTPYRKSNLLMSVVSAIQAAGDVTAADAYHLVETIEQKLIKQANSQKGWSSLSTSDIAHLTHQTLADFNPSLGVAYALQHGLLNERRQPRRKS